MAASTGALAAERERLEKEITELSKGLPPGAAELVKQADALMSEHASKIVALKQARDRLDAEFGVKAREAESAAAAARAAEEQRLRQVLLDAEARRLVAVGRCEQLLRKWVAATNEMVAAHEAMTKAASALTRGTRAIGGNTLSALDFTERFVGRLVSLLKTLKVHGAPHRLGRSLDLPNSSLHSATESWVEKERAVVEPVMRELTE
jgi:hypothetical protein